MKYFQKSVPGIRYNTGFWLLAPTYYRCRYIVFIRNIIVSVTTRYYYKHNNGCVFHEQSFSNEPFAGVFDIRRTRGYRTGGSGKSHY